MALFTVIPIDLLSLFLFQMSRSLSVLSQLLAVPFRCTEGTEDHLKQLVPGGIELGCPDS